MLFPSGQALEVFYSYAHEDKELCEELEKHLSALQRQGFIMSWHDGQIDAGAERTLVIDNHLSRASVILLLISPDFIASDYCYSFEMSRALERHRAKEACVVPILLRPVDWEGTPFSNLQALPTNVIPITSWTNRDEAFLNVAKGLRAVIEKMRRSSATTDFSSLSPIWNVPHPRNPFFTGREDLLEQLSITLRPPQATLVQPQAITGLGGIGKSQFAIEYAYRHCHEYYAVFWVRANTSETLISDFGSIADLLDLSVARDQNQTNIIRAVKQWLRTHKNWLLILDNADDLPMLKKYIPPTLGGHLLLTTRTHTLGKIAQRFELDVMDLEVGTLFLLRRAGIIPVHASHGDISTSDYLSAKTIVQETGGLPLALDQAGAYIEEASCSVSDYLELFRNRRSDLLNRRGGLGEEQSEPVATTWLLSLKRIEKTNPAAIDFLRLCTFLSSDAIPEEILTDGMSHLGPRLQLTINDQLLFDQTINILLAYSLIRRDPLTKTLSIHRLVQAVLQDEMDEETSLLWAKRAILAVNEAFPDVDFLTWFYCQRCLPHAQICITFIQQFAIVLPSAASLLNKTGQYLAERAQYVEAALALQQALVLREQVLGFEHPDTARSVYNLAFLYLNQGKYIEAEPLFLRALTLRKQVLEPEHPDLAQSLEGLALLYKMQRKYAEAEPLFQQALALRKRVLGVEHIDTVKAISGLAQLYEMQRKYAEAEPLFQQALALRKQILGSRNPSVAKSQEGLAILYSSQGKWEEAESLFRQALAIREHQLGLEHPDTALCLNNLAYHYIEQGRYRDAGPLCKRALHIYEKLLGPDHTNTIIMRENYKFLLQEQERPFLLRLLHIITSNLSYNKGKKWVDS